MAEVEKRSLRCAIYTRKSTEEGLEQAFNSLDAQREAAEAFISSQQARGWLMLPEHYDDGGYSGSNIERPALQRLLRDVDAGRIDCVMVYKVDRLSRSLLDFARLMERFERSGVSFVSVTQEFNTTTSMGRLTLNILLSFAQFERDVIGERTRDKMSAAKRKGKWIGGWPVLGYDIEDGRLMVNEKEAEQVRAIYRIAAAAPTLEAVVKACATRGYQTKCWTSRGGRKHPGRTFSRMTLRLLLRNVLYTGSVWHKGSVYPGEHKRIIDQQLWDNVNRRFRSGDRLGKKHRTQASPLAGMLFCAECGNALGLTHTTRHGKRYQYYSCRLRRAKQKGVCFQKPVGADDLESALFRALEPILGAALTWDSIGKSVARIECQARSRRISIHFHDGTRSEYRMPQPIRPGVAVEVTSGEEGRVPRISRLMALAIKFEALVREGKVPNYRSLAEAGCVSRARLSQILRLAELAPVIQEQLLFLPKTVTGVDPITERALRQIAKTVDWERQTKIFSELMLCHNP